MYTEIIFVKIIGTFRRLELPFTVVNDGCNGMTTFNPKLLVNLFVAQCEIATNRVWRQG